MAQKKEKAGAGKKIVLLLVILLFLLTAGAYGYGVSYFSSHFLPGSMVNGFNCSYMTSEETEELLNRRVGAYVIAVETMRNGQEGISAEDVGLSYVSTGIVKQKIKEQDRFTWFLAFEQNKNYDISEALSYNIDKMALAVENMNCMQQENVVQPVDAQIADTGEIFEIIPEVTGNALDEKKTLEVITAAMLRGERSVNLEAESCYRHPSVYSSDSILISNCGKMNQLCDIILTYDFADRTETVDRSLIKNWFGYNEDGEVILDEKLVREYVSQLGFQYDTMGQTRTFETYDNREKEIKGGDYGWVIDQDAEVKALIEAIESGVTQVREPVYLYEGYSRGTNDIGSTYVEIDLTNQRLVFYKKGTPIVDTAIVSGNPDYEGCATPTGCYSIDAMESPAVLTGEDYEANVSFWIPFAGNVGIHDASWRGEFGGNLYLWEGSHGCVNVPYDKAAAIYENIEVGMPVVVYE